MQISARRKVWEATLQGRERFNTWLKMRTLTAYRITTGNPNAIIPRKRKRKARRVIPTKDES